MAGIMAYVEKSDKDMIMFLASDGPMSNEDQLAQLQKIPPQSLSMEMFMRVDDFKEPQLLRDWMDAETTFIRERGGNEAHIAEAELHQPPPAMPSQDPSGQGDVYEGENDDATILWKQSASEDEILAFTRQGGWTTKGCGLGRQPPGGKGVGRGVQFRNNVPGGAALPPRGAQDLTCVICWLKGHSAGARKKAPVEKHLRPCFNCHEVGHIAAECPKPKVAPQARVVESQQQQQQQQPQQQQEQQQQQQQLTNGLYGP